jgi:WD40 repeat protein
MGKNVHVEFGRNEDEVVVFSDFASKVTVWCLKTGRTVEIRDQKFVGREGRGWGYRPAPQLERGGGGGVAARGGVMAILCRSSGQDVMLLLAAGTYEVLNRVELPTTDAAGLKWSRDGRWIAVWDSAAAGYYLHIYTADGHLYRTIAREPSGESREWAVEGLGIKSVEWIPGDQWLAVGGWDRRVRILSTWTFSPVVFLDHTAQIHVPSASVYTEHVDGMGARSYLLTQQPVTPPKAVSEKGDNNLKQGISVMAFNADGTLCATRDDSTPTTVWIWDLRSLRPKTILIQHAPVKSLSWHPSDPASLLIQAAQDSPTVYLYSSPLLSQSRSRANSSSTLTSIGPPLILPLSDTIARPAGSASLKWEARWLVTSHDKKPAFLFGHQQGYEIVWPVGKDQILRFDDGEADQSDDSLYDILTGRTPIPKLHGRDDIEFDDDNDGDGDDDSENFDGVAGC